MARIIKILISLLYNPGYNPVARRLKTFAIVAAVSGLTYKICDYMFFI